MEWYVLKTVACLFIFFGFYKLLLENTSAHTFKRFYLLAGILLSFLIPLVTFTHYVEVPQTTNELVAVHTTTIDHSVATASNTFWPLILWILYGAGVVFFAFRFGKNLFAILKKIKHNSIVKKNSFFHVLIQKKITPHTFFSYIFLNKTKYESNQIPKEVLLHEQAHAQQKHSLDIIFVELLHVVFWFNPLFVFLKKSIQLNHEFLADRAVLNKGTQTSTYQKLLLAYSSHATTPSLAHSINYSSFKKRFTVMKTQTSKKSFWLRSLVLLPLVALMLYGFSSKQTVVKEVPVTQFETDNKEKATKQQLKAYNTLAKKYNAIAIEDRKIPVKDLEVLESVYKRMTNEQKENAQPFPECYLENKIGRYDTYAQEYLEGAIKNNEKTFVLMININSVTINGKKSSIKTFKDDLNAVTEDWDKDDFERAVPSILIASASKEYLKKLEVEFQKTDYARYKKGATLLIPPPPPPAPDVPKPPKKTKKGESDSKANIPPPPPPPKVAASAIYPPPPPPKPNSNLVEYIKELAEKGATFYIGPHEYSADEAVKMVKKNKEASIDVSKYPKVQLNGC